MWNPTTRTAVYSRDVIFREAGSTYKTKEVIRVKELVDGGKNPLQQRETLPILQVPIRLTNVWCGKLDEVIDPLPF